MPDKYWHRIHFVRPRFKSNIENVLLYMANECCRIPRCSCEEYSSRYLNAIKMFQRKGIEVVVPIVITKYNLLLICHGFFV